MPTVFDRRLGLSSTTLYSLAQDAGGQLWIGTGEGLLRYDGDRWIPVAAPSEAPRPLIRAIEPSPDGSLWMVRRTHVLHFDKGKWTVISGAGVHGIEPVYSITLVRDDRGTPSPVIGAASGVFRVTADEKIEAIAMPPGFVATDAMVSSQVRAGGQHVLWIASLGGGVARLERGAWQTWSKPQGLDSLVDFVSAAPPGDSIDALAATSVGVFALKRNRWSRMGPVMRASRVLRVRMGDHYDTWIGSMSGDVLRSVDDIHFAPVAEAFKARGSRVQVLEAVDQGLALPTIFVGFRSGVLLRLRVGVAGRMVVPPALTGHAASVATTSRDGHDVWSWNVGTGPVRSPDFATPPPMPSAMGLATDWRFEIFAHSRDPNTELIAAGHTGAFRLRYGHWISDLQFQPFDTIRALFTAPVPGGLEAPLLVTRSHAYVESAQGVFEPWIGFPGGTTVVAVDSTGPVLGLMRIDERGALSRFDGNAWVTLDPGAPLLHQSVTSLATSTLESGERVAWIGTTNGLFACRFGPGPVQWRTFTMRTQLGMHSDFVRSIAALPDGHLAVSTTRGVSVFSLAKRLADSIDVAVNYSEADGLPHEGTARLGPIDARHRLWVATELGMGYIALDHMARDIAFRPPLAMVVRNANGDVIADSARLAYDASGLMAEVQLSTSHREDDTRYRLELDGVALTGQGWGARRTASQLSLTPGTHVLRGWAVDWRGRVSGPVTHTVLVTPPLWRTPIAYLLYAILAVGAWYLISELRLRGLRRRTMVAVDIATRLARSEERFRHLFDDGGDPQLLVNDGRIWRANTAALRLLEAGADALVDSPVKDVLPAWHERAAGSAPNSVLDLRQRDGALIPVEVRRTTIPLESDTLDHVAMRDLRPQRRLEEERRSLEDQLRGSQRLEALGTMAGGVAHDFNNVLTVIQANAELASHAESSAESSEALQQVLAASARARDVVRQILTFSRHAPTRRVPVSLSALLAELLPMLRSSIPSTVRIALNESAADAWLEGDPTQLHQMLLNLCTNAEYAMRGTGGDLTIATAWVDDASAAPPRMLSIRVTDTGVGMDETIAARVFDPFFTTKPIGEGTGLGLSVLHGIVGAHAGTVDVKSMPGSGTTFEVRLPTIPPPGGTANGSAGATVNAVVDPAANPLAPRRRVLIVDDEPAVASSLRRMLLRSGYDVEVASDGAAAVEHVRSGGQFALVISDQTMPGMTGDQVAEHIRSFAPDLPIVIASGYAEVLTDERLKSLRIWAVLEKPFSLARLREVADAAMDGTL